MYIIRSGRIRYWSVVPPLYPRGARFIFRMPAKGDIKSRCKITAFYANACAHIAKKCVKIDTFIKKISRANFFICVCENFFVPLSPFLKNNSNYQ